MRAMVVEDLRAGAARAGIPHRPEIVRCGDADDAFVRQAGDLPPVAIGFVVRMIDGDGQPIGIDAPFLRDEPPGQLDRALLEIVAEREIAEHLEESVVPRGVAHIVEIIVLAPGPHAFLRGGRRLVGARLQAGKHILERHHARIDEHQRRVVVRHQRRGRHHLMAGGPEIVEEGATDIVGRSHAPAIKGCRRQRQAVSALR